VAIGGEVLVIACGETPAKRKRFGPVSIVPAKGLMMGALAQTIASEPGTRSQLPMRLEDSVGFIEFIMAAPKFDIVLAD
jgi:hypothetical protein